MPQSSGAHVLSRSKVDCFIDEVRNFTSPDGRESFWGIHSPFSFGEVPVAINEFWTAKQRQANAIHEISYRACFKPQLPEFFIKRLTAPLEVVYDPFMGRGTTLIESALLGRRAQGTDINPLSQFIVLPRLNPPSLESVNRRLDSLSLKGSCSECREDLLVFYHPDTLQQLTALRNYLITRLQENKLDEIDRWIWMVALNRLTGHSVGFFSVYTLPPNQAVSIQRQQKINESRQQTPPVRDVKEIIKRKSRQLLKDISQSQRIELQKIAAMHKLYTASADATESIPSASISLVVTSPPFLATVNYAYDNWLRLWFAGLDRDEVKLFQSSNISLWTVMMEKVLKELYRVLVPGGVVAFEVGEVNKGKTLLDEIVVTAGYHAGLTPRLVMINDQNFTKTSHCWGVSNKEGGTNTNRIVVLEKSF